MEELLLLQYHTILTEWLIERGMTPSTDPVADVIEYYRYLDVLSIPTPNVELSNLVTSNDEIIQHIIEICLPHTSRVLKLVNKQWRRIAQRPVSTITFSIDTRTGLLFNPFMTYLQDAVRGLDWYHLSRALVSSFSLQHDVITLTAYSQGYALVLPLEVDQQLTTFQLCKEVVRGGNAERHKRLFLRLWSESCDTMTRYQVGKMRRLCDEHKIDIHWSAFVYNSIADATLRYR